MKSFKKILRYTLKYWEKAVLNAVFNISSILFSLVSMIMIAPFLQLLFGNQELITEKPSLTLSTDSIADYFNFLLSTIIIRYDELQGLLFICGLVLVAFLFKNMFRYLAVYATLASGRPVTWVIFLTAAAMVATGFPPFHAFFENTASV